MQCLPVSARHTAQNANSLLDKGSWVAAFTKAWSDRQTRAVRPSLSRIWLPLAHLSGKTCSERDSWYISGNPCTGSGGVVHDKDRPEGLKLVGVVKPAIESPAPGPGILKSSNSKLNLSPGK